MKLKFSNVGKISSGEIEVKGVTVIAGNNDTGKSTVGKLLYAIPTALSALTPYFLLRKKYESIVKELDILQRWVSGNYMKDFFEFGKTHKLLFIDPSFTAVADEMIEIEKQLNDLVVEIVSNTRKIVQDKGNLQRSKIELICNNLIANVDQSSTDKEVKNTAIQKILLTEFSNALTSNIRKGQPSEITIEEENGDVINLDFLDNVLQKSSQIMITRNFFKSLYVNSPFVLDRSRPLLYDENYLYTHQSQLIRCLYDMKQADNYFNEVIQKEIINEIFSSVIEGDIKMENEMGTDFYQYHTQNFSKPLRMESISTGIKSFAIIKLLLELGHLHSSEFLILDEPEIHLHPEWQLKYAELIVLLSKHYPIRILLTTHSPYFVEAIELYSKLHKINEDVRYYKTEPDGEMSKIMDVTNCIEKLYEDMARPFRKLEELEDELNAE